MVSVTASDYILDNICNEIYNEGMHKKIVRKNAEENYIKESEKKIASATQHFKEKGIEFSIFVNDDGVIEMHFDTSNLSEDKARQFNDNIETLLQQKLHVIKLDELTALQEKQRRIELNNSEEEFFGNSLLRNRISTGICYGANISSI